MLPDSLAHIEVSPPMTRVSKTFRIDHEKGRVVSEKIDGIEAIKQAIWVNLSVEKGVWNIHTDGYGVEFAKLYGKHRDYARAMIEPIVRRALSWDERIYGVSDFTITDLGKSKLLVEFEVSSCAGTFTTGVEMNV